jgi:hypothetical protein
MMMIVMILKMGVVVVEAALTMTSDDGRDEGEEEMMALDDYVDWMMTVLTLMILPLDSPRYARSRPARPGKDAAHCSRRLQGAGRIRVGKHHRLMMMAVLRIMSRMVVVMMTTIPRKRGC